MEQIELMAIESGEIGMTETFSRFTKPGIMVRKGELSQHSHLLIIYHFPNVANLVIRLPR